MNIVVTLISIIIVATINITSSTTTPFQFSS